MIKSISICALLLACTQLISCKTIKLADTPIVDGSSMVDGSNNLNNNVKTVNLTDGSDVTTLAIPNKEGINQTVVDLETLKKQELEKLMASKSIKKQHSVDMAQFRLKSVYFDFDNFSVRSSDEEGIKEHGDFLQKHTDHKLILQGHTDERGGREYNLALGQKRAEAVRQFLSVLGVSEEQLEAISFGEEKPANKAHHEKAWQENRRVDFYYE